MLTDVFLYRAIARAMVMIQHAVCIFELELRLEIKAEKKASTTKKRTYVRTLAIYLHRKLAIE